MRKFTRLALPDMNVNVKGRSGAIFGLLLFLCVMGGTFSSYGFATRYAVAGGNTPSGTTSYCSGSSGSAYTSSTIETSCSAGSTNTDNITATWYFDGTSISGPTAIGSANGSSHTATLAAGTITSGMLTVGTHSLYCKFSSSKSNCSYGASVNSPTLSITVLANIVPGAPTDGSPSSTCNTITLNWSPDANADQTEVTVATNAGFTTGVLGPTLVSGGTTTLSSLSGGTTYYYKYRSYRTCGGYSVYTSTGTITTAATPTISAGGAICPTQTATLVGSPSGGTWTSATVSVATVDGSGNITPAGILGGTSVISYGIGGGTCYATTTETVNPGPSTITVTPVVTTVCSGNHQAVTASATSPGAATTVVSNNFESGSLTTGTVGGAWTTGGTFGTTADRFAAHTNGAALNGVTVNSGAGTYYAGAIGQSQTGQNTYLESPVFSLVGYTSATLTYLLYHLENSTNCEVAPTGVQISTDGGTSWTVIDNIANANQGSATSFATRTIDLTSYAGLSNLRLEWIYSVSGTATRANNARQMGVDNISVTASPGAVASASFTWSAVSGGVAGDLSCTACSNPTITPSVFGVDIYSVTTTYGSCTSTAGVNVTYTGTAPTLPTVTSNTTCNSLTLSWLPGTGADNFNVVISTHSDMSSPVFSGLVGNVLTYTQSSLSGGTAYYYTVQGSNSCGGSGPTTSVANKPTAATPTISAGGTICPAQTATLIGSPSGGTWTSATASVVTVAGGVLTPAGIAGGTSVISYGIGGGTCFATTTETINAGPSTISISPASANPCLGTGTAFTASATSPAAGTAVFNNFNTSLNGNSGQIGGDWTITNTGAYTGGYTWADVAPSAETDYTVSGDGTNYMRADPNLAGNGNTMITSLVSPSFSTLGTSSGSLAYNFAIESSTSYDTYAEVDYSTNGGSSWNLITNYLNTTSGSTSWTAGTPTVTTPLPAGALNHSSVQIRFYFYSDWGFYWAVDNVKITTTPGPVASSSFTWSGPAGLSCTACSSPTITPTASGLSVYSVSTTYGGCTSTAGVTVNANSGPSITTQPTTLITLCTSGTFQTLSVVATAATGYQWYKNSSASYVGATSIGGATAATYSGGSMAAGTTYYYCTTSNSCGSTNSGFAKVVVNTAPVAITGNAPMCPAGSTVTLGETSGGGTWSSSTGAVSINSTTGVMTPSSSGNPTITYANGAGAGCSASVTATVNATPVAITGNTPMCPAGSTVTLGEPSGGGTWSSSTGAVSIGVTSGVMTPSSAGNPTITYANGAGSGCQATITATVNTTPVAITGNAPMCPAGSTVTLGETSGSGTWSSSSGAVSINSGTGVMTPSSAGNPTITYSNGAGAGCSASVTATVNATPVAITGNTPMCPAGSTVTLVETSGGGTWSSSTGAVSINATTGVMTPNSAGNPAITYANGAGAGCSTGVTATVNPTPSLTTVNPGDICSNTNTSITLTSSVASTYTWTVTPAAQISGTSNGGSVSEGYTISQTLLNSDNSAAHSVVYHIKPTSVTGACPGSTTDITQNVNPTPALTTTNPSDICSNTNTSITLTSTTPSTYVWTQTPDAQISGSSDGTGNENDVISQTLLNSDNSAAHSVVYHITPTAVTGSCPGSPVDITQNVNPTPSLTTTNPADICNNTNTSITLTSTTPSTYVWTQIPDAQISGSADGTGNENDVISQTLLNSDNSAAHSVVYHITPTAVTGSCPGSPVDITQNVNPTPSLTTTNPSDICSNTNTSITLTSTTPSTYVWTQTPDAQISGSADGTGNENDVISQTLLNSDNSAAHSVVYHITPTAVTGSCPGSPVDITQNVNPTPSLTTTNPADICNNTNTSITLTSSTPSTYVWTQIPDAQISGSADGTGNENDVISQTLLNSDNSAAHSVVYHITPTAVTGSCPGSPVDITQNVNPTPSLTTTNPADICSNTNTSITLTSTTPSTYVWTQIPDAQISGSSDGTGNENDVISQTLLNSDNSAAHSVVYHITPTAVAGSCPGSPVDITQNVNPTPSLTTTNPADICNNTNTSITLTSTTPSTYVWTQTPDAQISGSSDGTGNENDVISQTLLNSDNSAAHSVVYHITPTAVTGSCPGSPVDITQNVNPTPSLTTTNPADICNNTNTSITLTSTTPSTYVWTQTPDAQISGSADGTGNENDVISQTLLNSDNSAAHSVVYHITPTAVTGSCPGSPVDITQNVNPTPSLTTTNPANICDNTNTSITLTSTVPSTYVWTQTPDAQISGSSDGTGNENDVISQTLINSDHTTAYNVVYHITPTAVGGSCPGSSTDITQVVNPSPVISTTAPANICNGTSTSIDLAARSSIPSTFVWGGYSPDIVTGYTVSGTASLINDVLANTDPVNQGTVVYTITPTDIANSCVGVAAVITQTVNPSPSPITGSAVLCAGGDHITLGESALGGTWTSNNASASVDQATGEVTPNSAGNPTITYSDGTDPSCSTTVGLTVNAAPAPISGNPNLCILGSSTFLSDASAGGTWTSGTTGVATIDQVTGSITPVGLGNSIITYTNGLGAACSTVLTATVNPLPGTVVASGAGTFCGSTTITASGGGGGTTIYFEGTTSGGTSTAIASASRTVTSSGTYYFRAQNNSTGCWGDEGSVTVTINPNPTAYSMTGGGTYCTGGSGLDIGLSGSEILAHNINYELYYEGSATGTIITGNGGPIHFGLQTASGTYSVLATNPSTTCSAAMTGSVTVISSPVPNVYAVTGGGGYCAGGTGKDILLSNSQSLVSYQLYNGTATVGSPVAGTGSPIDFAVALGVSGFTDAGIYTIVANPGSPCAATMSGSPTITVNPAPAINTVTGGGTICSGDAGPSVYLSSSEVGVNYQLFNSVVGPEGSPKPGTGFELVFTNNTDAGVYSIVGINTSSSCQNTMTLTATVNVNPLPALLTVMGTGSYCAGGSGVDVQLSGTSETNVDYTLLKNGVSTGLVFHGDGVGGYDFGNQLYGTYTVLARNILTGCTKTMTGSAVVTLNPSPAVYNVTGGGSYCSGSGGSVPVGLSFSSASTTYQLYNDVSGPVGIAQTGTGAAISFGNQSVAGTYSVVASSGGCNSEMNGTATVSVNPLPNNTYTLAGGGSYCSGSGGLDLTMTGGSESGVSYQLYLNGFSMGSPVIGGAASLDFGNQTGAGTYQVVATNMSTTCSNTLTSTTSITVKPLPAAFTVTGGGTLCSGGTPVAIGLSNSSALANYTLYNGITLVTAQAGVNGTLSFPPQSTAGTYVVVADSNGCSRNMNGSATVTVNPLPTAYAVSGGGTLCSGGTGASVLLSNSDLHVNYQLLLNGVATGSPVSGTGFGLNFGAQTAAGAYAVSAINSLTGCSTTMTGSVSVTVNTPPAAYAVTGGGGYCPAGTGVHVGLAQSEAGVTYQLFLNGSPVGGASINNLSGTAPLDFGLQTGIGTYTIGATNNSTSCTSTMTGSVSVYLFTPPTPFTVTGGGGYCPGGAGVDIGLSGSQSGGNYQYQLYVGGTPVSPSVILTGTGFSLDFGNQPAGNYTVVATNMTTGCTTTMSGSTTVVLNAQPTAFNVGGGGSFCSGGTGVDVTIDGTQIGVNYQLFHNGSPTGSPIGGSGFAYDFGNQTANGVYTASAINVTTGCVAVMSNSATVTVNPLPTAYVVTGGGHYCSGGAGVDVSITGTESGVSYQLLRGSLPVGTPVTPGTTAGYDFGNQSIAGNYTVSATNTGTGCTNTMTGNAVVSIDPLPALFVVTGTGSYCSGGTGLHVGLSGSATGDIYQLYNSSGAVGSPIAGTNSALDFGIETAESYSVVATDATTGCSQTMSGSAVITTYPLPAQYNVTGGGGYCVGGNGMDVALDNSQTGVNYQLYLGSTATGAAIGGTGHAIDFGMQTAVGTYSVAATNATTTCNIGMTGGATVYTNSLPVTYNVTGTGSYCSGGTGVAVGLDNSENGINYQLYLGSTIEGASVPGGGSAITFGSQITAGTYTVLATNGSTGCQNVMNGGATVTINPLPNTAFSVTGGGSFCSGGTGVHVGLSSSNTGISYQLYNGAAATGSPVVGTNSGLDFGLQTTAGTYTVLATNTITGCSAVTSGSATVTVNPLPTAYNVSGGGGYCAGGTGVDISLSGSQIGVSYQLLLNGAPNGSPALGTGAALDYGLRTIAGTYTIVANNGSTTCSANMTGSAIVTVNPLPTVYAMTGGGGYCAGGTGVHVGLVNSTNGVNYQLYNGAVAIGSPVPGAGAAIDFGLIATAGTYTVLATDATSGCTREMSGSETVTINPLPTAFTVTGGGSFCDGSAGVHFGLSGSEFGFSYQVYRNGVPYGAAHTGTSGVLDFGLTTDTGTYTVMATNPATACINTMNGNAVVSVNPLPAAHTVTGGGSYCAGGAGSVIGLDGSNTGISYQLYNASGTAGSAVTGTGSAISFGAQTTAGTYTVVATDMTTGCHTNMNGTETVTINALPNVYTVSGGGGYCMGGAGVHVGLTNSTIGISYQLYNGSTAIGTYVAGTGSALDFGLQTAAGTYSVNATNVPTGCMSNMSGGVTVTIHPLPAVYAVTGGGAYCAGTGGIDVGLANSDAGINYQLYNGSSAVGGTHSGAGGIDFGLQIAAGTYSVLATDAITGCTNNMSGSAIVSITALPTVYTVTGGGSYCQGGTGVNIGLSNSDASVTYRLYNTGSGTPVATVTGVTGGINFGPQTAAGTYTVSATNSSSCITGMNSSVLVIVNPLPNTHAVTASGTAYCAGGSGITIGLDGSDAGIVYQLYNGSAPVGGTVAGGSGAITFGQQLTAGTYTVTAINSTTGCRAGMSGNAPVNINTVPNAYTVLGGGSYCQGTAGADVYLSNSEGSSVLYSLNNAGGTIAVLPGVNGVLDFGPQTAGTYSVVATNTSFCNTTMSGTAVVTMNPLPAVHNVTGTGSYCQGGAGLHIGLDGSDLGISYQLWYSGSPSGSAVAGTGSAIDFGTRTAGGLYTVVATNSTTGCTNNMGGNALVTVNGLPAVYAVTGGGNYCQGGTGVSVGLTNSDNNVNYILYRGSSAITTLGGNTLALDFGLQTAGTYTVMAQDAFSGCSSNMYGSATVTVNPLPTVFNVTGGGHYCASGAGVHVNLSGSDTGIAYQLFNSSGTVGAPVNGTGSAIDLGLQTTQDSYSVVATNLTTTCINNMNGSAGVTIDPLPTTFSVNGGGSYCQGGTGVDISLANSQSGISYQLFDGSLGMGTPQAGGIGAIDFGLQTTAGTYVVVATDNTSHCTSSMTGAVVVSVNSLPTAYTVYSSATSYCAGGAGVAVSLSGSDTGINYQLFDGTTPVGAALAGTGAPLNFGQQTAPGIYTVKATNNATGCVNLMSTSVSISISPTPIVYALTGGGGYCQGGTGVHIGLNGSESGIRYDLYNGSLPSGSVMGTGSAIDFGLQSVAGVYIVIATNTATGCVSNMSGTATVSINLPPTAFAVTGGGNFCTGGTGVDVQLAGSQSGVTYQLYNNGLPTGTPMGGTGSALDFGLRTASGVYTIIATNTTTSCVNSMTGSATVSPYPAPAVFAVTGGGSYCNGGTGVHVSLSGSESGKTYQLYNGSSATGTAVAGTGSAIDFGLQTSAGTYTVTATSTATGCTGAMSGNAVVSVNPLPTAYSVTGGGSYCSGTAGVHVGLNGSDPGISYQLYLGSTVVGTPINGTTGALDFGAQTDTGMYRVYAVDMTTGCTDNMNGSATVIMHPTVVPSITMITTPGDTVCAGTNVAFATLAGNGGSTPSYQWFVNTVNVSIADNYNYVPSNGDVVTVQMTSSAFCATPATVSASQTMVVNPNLMPAVSIAAAPGDTVCKGTMVTFTATPTNGGATPTYSWLQSGVPVGSAPTFTYIPAQGDAVICVMNSSYACRLANSVFSTPIVMTVDTPTTPIVTIVATPGNSIAKGQPDTLTAVVTNGGPVPAYQWYLNGGLIPGANSSRFINSNYNDGDSVTCQVTSSGACGGVDGFNSVIIYVSGTGVASIQGTGDVRLMPNPNKGDFTLKGTLASKADQDVAMEITDVLGQVVYKTTLHAHGGVIDEHVHMGGGIANGMYVLGLHSATDNLVFHVVVEQ